MSGESTAALEYNDSFAEFMHEINQHFTKLVHESYKAPRDAWEEWQAFKTAVNWNEQFLLPLLAVHVILLLSVIALRKNSNAQFFLFCLIFVIVLSAQYLNQWCSDHWESFATQNYFEKRGTFMAVFLCAPLLFIATIQLIFFLIETSKALIQMKKLQFAAEKLKKGKSATALSNINNPTQDETPTKSKRSKKLN